MRTIVLMDLGGELHDPFVGALILESSLENTPQPMTVHRLGQVSVSSLDHGVNHAFNGRVRGEQDQETSLTIEVEELPQAGDGEGGRIFGKQDDVRERSFGSLVPQSFRIQGGDVKFRLIKASADLVRTPRITLQQPDGCLYRTFHMKPFRTSIRSQLKFLIIL